MIAPEFLDVEEVLEIHALQLDEFGGIAGVRDRGLFESAVEQARATAFGELLHADLFEMAAAYLFHIVKYHAFLDGNKRTALVTRWCSWTSTACRLSATTSDCTS